MKTTRKQARLLYEIAYYVDPYNCFYEEDTIDILMQYDIPKNIEKINKLICDNYDIKELLDDHQLIEKLSNFYKSLTPIKNYKAIKSSNNLPF